MRFTTKGEICAGITPNPVSGKPNFAFDKVIATSETHAKPKPPPNTAPSSTATTV